jgi:hypothetical protein
MRWFKHDCDMHTDLKIQNLIEKHGLEGYAIFNLCLELLGKEGSKGKIDGQLRWRQVILKVSGWSDEGRLDKVLETMAEQGLICGKSLKYGHLHIPKFVKRADEYTLRKLRTNSEHSTDNVRAEQNRTEVEKKENIDKILGEYLSLQKIDAKDNAALMHDLYVRNCRPIKKLLSICKTPEEASAAIKWVAGWLEPKGLSWTLETVIKHYTTYLKETAGKTGIDKWRVYKT